MLAQGADLWLSPWLLGLLGLLIGSFLNVVIHRLPAMEMRDWWAFDVGDYALRDPRSWLALTGSAKSAPPKVFGPAAQAIEHTVEQLGTLSLLRPASRCPACGHRIRWYENIPVVSWLVLRGKCSACKTPISVRYPLVELLTGAMFAALAVVHGPGALTVVFCVAAALLIAMGGIDLDTTLLPEKLTIALIGLGGVAALTGWSGTTPVDALAGALLGYGVLWALGFLWAVLFRKKNAMAEGDMKMLCGLGALLGWQALPGLLLLAAGLGAVIGIAAMMFKGQGSQHRMAFGPYLALGGLVAMLAGPALAGFGSTLGEILLQP
ncbi:MAG: prepilin peptidase [Rubrivivax sp.]|jgi:leader peptidase (prepilin peptidase)/N-methyltransferase|nr:prepilin peptidase [Rubrivivax sp.]